MVKKINALKARKNLGQLLEEVYYKDNQYVIERAGRPMAAVVPVWQLEGWRKRRERLCGLQVPTGRGRRPPLPSHRAPAQRPQHLPPR